MSNFQSLREVIRHAKLFNALFYTMISALCSLSVAALCGWLGAFNFNKDNWGGAVIILALLAVPVVVFSMVRSNDTIRVPLYKKWLDFIKGHLDRPKFLRQFADHYHLSLRDVKKGRVEVAKNWNFHAEMPYAEVLSSERDYLLRSLATDYQQMDSLEDKNIKKQLTLVGTIRLQLAKKEQDEADIKQLASAALSAGEKYVQRRRLAGIAEEIVAIKKELEHQEKELSRLENQRKKLAENYRLAEKCLREIYDDRYRNYSALVVKKINRIEHLKYDVVGLK